MPMRLLPTHLFSAALAFVLMLTVSTAAAAQNLDYSTGNVDRGFGANANDPGQTFTVPAGVNRLTSVSLGTASIGGNASSYIVFLDTYPTATPGGLASQTFSNAPVFSPGSASYRLDTVTLPGQGLAVTPGQTYWIRVRMVTPTDPLVLMPSRMTSVYPGGFVADSTGGTLADDAFFRASFQNVAPAPVPTLSEWAMILFGVALAGLAGMTVARKRIA